MRTITVVFTNRMLSVKEMLSHKRYKFLCNYDTISLYDMVEDPRYTSKVYILESYILKGKKMQSKQSRFLVRE